MPKNAWGLREPNGPKHLLVEYLPNCIGVITGILADLFNYEHGVSPDFTALKEVKVVALLSDVVNNRSFRQENSLKIVFKVHGLCGL
jgi:hypothetical protein